MANENEASRRYERNPWRVGASDFQQFKETMLKETMEEVVAKALRETDPQVWLSGIFSRPMFAETTEPQQPNLAAESTPLNGKVRSTSPLERVGVAPKVAQPMLGVFTPEEKLKDYEAVLTWIASQSDAAMGASSTLHYEIRSVARAVRRKWRKLRRAERRQLGTGR